MTERPRDPPSPRRNIPSERPLALTHRSAGADPSGPCRLPGTGPGSCTEGGAVAADRVIRESIDVPSRRPRTRWKCGRVPTVDEDPAWIIRETGRDPLRHRVTESLFTLGAGGFATRGSVEEAAPGSVPLVLASGIYTETGAGEHLLPGPQWTGLDFRPAPEEDLRVLDLRTGVVARKEIGHIPPVRTLRFASVSRPGVVAMRAEAESRRISAGPPLQPSEGRVTGGRLDDHYWARTTGGCAGIAAVAVQRAGRDGEIRILERIAAYTADAARQPVLRDAVTALEAAEDLGFDGRTRVRRRSPVPGDLPGCVVRARLLRGGSCREWTGPPGPRCRLPAR